MLLLPARIALASLLPLAAANAVTTMAPEIVTAARTPQAPTDVAATLTVFEGIEVQRAPSATIDGALRGIPAFSLFRRSDSLTANPTAQGVSLRGLGPSGASRSLVLFDGVPLNDPFGGWVAWSKLPREGLLGIEVLPGGGATAWGNAALGGVVHVRRPRWSSRGTRLAASAGDFGTHSVELSHAHRTAGGSELLVEGRAFGTDGFTLIAPERRGPIDVAAWSRHRWVSARWRQALAPTLSLAATVRGYEEKRGNGTPYQRNETRERFASLALAGQAGDNLAWTADAYAQDQTFASTFGAVNATRTIETPASDQFAVPATAFGAAWTGAWQHRNHARTSFGADGRWVSGETRENATFSAGAFTRQRIAGGKQIVGGVFALHEHPFTPTLRATVGARFDAWADQNGHRRETDLINGAVLRDDHYGDRDGSAISPSLGLVWQPSATWRMRASAQRAFRRPTLNELYRPFRVGPNVTEANASLRTEYVNSGELGAEWRLLNEPKSAATTPAVGTPGAEAPVQLTSYPAPVPRSLLTLQAVVFWNDLHDAVGNVTLVRGPGNFPVVGFIPAGGVGRQRQNLDRLRVRGFELSAKWRPTRVATLTADYLYNDATITRAHAAPGLVGKRVAQVPRHTAVVSALVKTPGKFTFTPRLRWIGRQFEDDENQLRLGEVVIVDATITHALSAETEIFLTIENLTDARIETGRTADGVVNVGTPRFAFGGVRLKW